MLCTLPIREALLAGSGRTPSAAGPRCCTAQPATSQAGHGRGGGARSFGSRLEPHGRGARHIARQPGARWLARQPPGVPSNLNPEPAGLMSVPCCRPAALASLRTRAHLR